MNDKLSKYEKQFGKVRTEWSKAEWRKVAYQLAGIVIPETRGRKTLSDKEKYEKEQNLRAAEFWRDQEINLNSVIDGDAWKVEKRTSKIPQRTATKKVIHESIRRQKEIEADGESLKPRELDKKTDALVRKIQISQKNRREK